MLIDSRYVRPPFRRKFNIPVRREERRPSQADFGLDVTICIAAVTKSGMADGHIVAVSDQMISNADYVPAADDGALKARKLSKTWAVMVAAENVSLFLPVVDNVKNKLRIFDDAYDLIAVQSAVTEAYRTLFNAEFTASYLARYGMCSISEFRTLGRVQFGDDKFHTICNAIDEYSLGIELLVYGFDADKKPHIFQVSNPGSVTNHDLLGYGVIGSGFYMATSSMRR
jgi:hypothetical protein